MKGGSIHIERDYSLWSNLLRSRRKNEQLSSRRFLKAIETPGAKDFPIYRNSSKMKNPFTSTERL